MKGRIGTLVRGLEARRSLLLMILFALACTFALAGSSLRLSQASLPASVGSMDTSFDPNGTSLVPPPKDDRGLYYTTYQVQKGDTTSQIAEQYNVTLDTVISCNDIKQARGLRPGQVLRIPSMAGILYTAKAGDTAQSVAEANKISADRVIEINGLMTESLEAGKVYFLPDARLASFKLREISGDLFHWPARGWITSYYGWRNDPFTDMRSFHNGLDIGVDVGTPIQAAMDGIVADTGYSSISGNYVLIAHHGGWSSFYCHLSRILVGGGERVRVGDRIGLSGNTGYTTGPHVHFSVFKDGRSVNPLNVLH
ncbi:MAG: peptidoglycan DD-metalloendopeptidase family protein [Rectinemataceae bacterium]